MSPASPAHAPSPTRKLYFVNGWVDGAMIGGLGLVMFAAFKVFCGDRNIPIFPQMAIWLSWVVNWPHFSATNYRLYHSRQNIAQYPVTALALPFLIVGAMLASFYSPLACPRCGGRLRLIALLDESAVTQRILRHLGLPTEVPEARPARAPPLRDTDA